MADPLEQGLFAGGGSHRPRTHGKVAFGGNLPAGILGGHASSDGLIGAHGDGGPRKIAGSAGLDCDMPQSGQADFRQAAACFQTTARVHATIDQTGAGGRPADQGRSGKASASSRSQRFQAISLSVATIEPRPVCRDHSTRDRPRKAGSVFSFYRTSGDRYHGHWRRATQDVRTWPHRD